METAIRGGAEAEAALTHAVQRRFQAEQALASSLADLGGDVGEAAVERMRQEYSSLVARVDQATETAKEWVKHAAEVQQRTGESEMTASTLRDLSLQFTALMRIGEALKRSEAMDAEGDVGILKTGLQEVDAAREFCFAGNAYIFERAGLELAQRREDAISAIRTRIIDAVALAPSALEIRRCDPTATFVLAERPGLIEETLGEVVRTLRENPDLLWAIRKAEAFVCMEDDLGTVAIEWSRHRTYPFDFASSVALEGKAKGSELPKELATVPDIANVGARVQMLFQVLVEQLLGGMDSPHVSFLAQSLWQWFTGALFTPMLVLASDGPSSTAIVPASMLQKRSYAVFHLSRWIPELISVQPNPPLFASREEFEKLVATELRSESLLRARRAINDFVLDDEDHVLLAPIASPWRPKERRNASWFPSCLVTKTAVHVKEVVHHACTDAAAVVSQGGNEENALPNAFLGAAKEALDAYRTDVPILHQQALVRSLKLRCLYHNDCLMLAHVFSNLRSTAKLLPSSMKLRSAGNEMLLEAISSECEHLRKSVKDSWVGNGSLAFYGTPRVQQRCDEDMMRAIAHMQEVSRVFSAMLPAGAAATAAFNLCTELLTTLTSAVLNLPEIAASACDGLQLFLAGAVSNCQRMTARERPKEADVDTEKAYLTATKRVDAFKEILNIHMEDIVENSKSGKYDNLVEKDEVTESSTKTNWAPGQDCPPATLQAAA